MTICHYCMCKNCECPGSPYKENKMTQTLDQYKDEYAIERDRARILFGTTPYSEYLEHIRAAAALMLNLWQGPTPERMNTDVHRASWHLDEAEALREAGFKEG